VDFDMSMLEAVAAPRFSATSPVIDVSNRIPTYVTAALESQGYEVVRSPLSYAFAAVHGIKIAAGVCSGGADPGLDGVALAV
jgi:gamma-glutamyltranspeptidase/glutathione hydrolase